MSAPASDLEIEARVTVNASGAWAGRIATLAGIEGVRVLPRPGNHDRDEPPAGEHGHQPLPDADRRRHHRADPDRLGDRHDRPAHRGPGRPYRAAVRGRPACSTTARSSCPGSGRRARCASGPACGRCSRTRRPPAPTTRDVTRAHALLDHRARDGVDGFVTITGGKVTTFRLMAEETVDAVCDILGTQLTLHDGHPTAAGVRRAARTTSSASASPARRRGCASSR